jgi:hypothetical protein
MKSERHCDHECVCFWYRENFDSAVPCHSTKCPHRIYWDDAPSEQDIRENERKQWIGRLQYIENLLNAHWKTAYSNNPPEITAIIEKIQKFISKGC